jgi:hypothetical protein
LVQLSQPHFTNDLSSYRHHPIAKILELQNEAGDGFGLLLETYTTPFRERHKTSGARAPQGLFLIRSVEFSSVYKRWREMVPIPQCSIVDFEN